MRSNFKRIFIRGLTILLPSVLTVWLLIAGYSFVRDNIADPINSGLRQLIPHLSQWPVATEQQILQRQIEIDTDPKHARLKTAWKAAPNPRQWMRFETRRVLLAQWWREYALPLDLIGILIAVILIYLVGGLLGSFIGHKLYRRGELLLKKIPLYSSVRQVTDVLLGSGTQDRIKFSRVVAVEYPRRGLWSVGLVTGDTMRTIRENAQTECLTVFVPSSPTPFTGYVITVPKVDTIDLNISIDEALRFTISGGVIIPAPQQSGLTNQPQSDGRVD